MLLGPPVVLPFVGEGSPTKIDYREKGTLILRGRVGMGAEFFRFLGAEFFRFLGAEFFQKNKKNTAHHLHLLVQGHGSVFCCCCFLFLFFLVPLLINTKKTKKTQPII